MSAELRSDPGQASCPWEQPPRIILPDKAGPQASLPELEGLEVCKREVVCFLFPFRAGLLC